MKNMKKIASLLLALLMVFSLSVTAFADGESGGDTTTPATYTITINGARPGHTFEAYQIFTGELHNGVLSNIKWGNGQSTYLAGTDATDFVATLSPENVVSEMKKLTLTNLYATSRENGNVYTISGLPAGYYLVKDQANTLNGEYAAYTDYMMLVVEDTAQTIKSSVPTIEKKVTDIDDSSQPVTGGDTHQDSADYDIGDDVPFHIHVKLNNHLDSYKTYKLVVTDTMSKGLTYNNDAVITLSDVTVGSEHYNIETTQNSDGTTTLVITFDDIIPLNPNKYADLIIDYTAKLNESANIGSVGNTNTVSLQFSNNPDTDEMGETPDDTVIVFTYKVIVDKVNHNGDPLPGASFSLYKKVYGENDFKFIKTIDGTALTKFEFNGIDDGIYRIVETVTPAGYNTIAPIEFKVEASHVVLADNPTLESLNGDPLSGQVTFTPDTTDGSLSTTVVNKAGATLPETGGMGTTMLYVVGGILVLAAVVLLVTKKRMTTAE